MRKTINGVFLPDEETYLDRDIEISPKFSGMGTMQFKKFAAAFRYITEWRHAIDVGANVGLWTRVMAKCFETVHAFEPNWHCYEAFRANTGVGGLNPIYLNECALGAEEGKVLMTMNGGPSIGHARIDKKGDLAVRMKRMDDFDFGGPIDFIKIDVEGFEAKVVRGGEQTIRKWRPLVIVEQKPNNAEYHGMKQYDALDLLKSWGAEFVVDMGGDMICRWKRR